MSAVLHSPVVAEATQQQSQTMVELSRLRGRADALLESITKLEAQLAPVILLQEEQKSVGSSPRPVLVPFAGYMYDEIEKLEIAHQRLSSIMMRLQL